MAGRTLTDMYRVLTDRLVTKVIVKRRHTGDVGRCDFGQLADALQGRLRQVPIVMLQRLQNGNHGIAPGSTLGNHLLNNTEVKFGSNHARMVIAIQLEVCDEFYFVPIQIRCCSPRM